MKKTLATLVGVVILVSGIAYLTLERTDKLVLIDEDCPSGTRYPLATTLFAVRASHGGVTREDLRLVDVSGRSRRLTSDHASFDPSFSPDGSQLVFTNGYGDLSDTTGWAEQGISVIDVDGNGYRTLTRGERDAEPVWSPEGDLIAFVRDESRLMVVRPWGGEPRLVYEHPAEGVQSPQWSSDGERIAFLGGGSVRIISESGEGLREVASQLGDAGLLRWSPDGETFAYGAGTAIYTLSEEEPNPRELVDDAVIVDFAPEGDHLLYQDVPDLPDAEVRLAATSVPDGEPLVIKPPLYVSGDAAWLDCS